MERERLRGCGSKGRHWGAGSMGGSRLCLTLCSAHGHKGEAVSRGVGLQPVNLSSPSCRLCHVTREVCGPFWDVSVHRHLEVLSRGSIVCLELHSCKRGKYHLSENLSPFFLTEDSARWPLTGKLGAGRQHTMQPCCEACRAQASPGSCTMCSSSHVAVPALMIQAD